jgi:SAM-dependent methyltransferase
MGRPRPRADRVFEALHLYRDLPEPESRFSELVEYFGWEIAHRGPACRRWFFRDDPRFHRFLERTGLTYWQFAVLHQYLLFNRFDPARWDMWWVYDEVCERMEALGGRDALEVLDFGCGLGQIGLGFTLDGWRTVLTDVEPKLLDFARFLFAGRGLEAEIVQAESERSYLDTTGRRLGCVVEWSVFEHVHDHVAALEAITAGLVRGGVLVTTTLAKDWTPAVREHYIRDAGEAEIAEQLFSPAVDAWVRERFEIVDEPMSFAKLLIKR